MTRARRITGIRQYLRQLMCDLEHLKGTLAGGDLPTSEVYTLLEIDASNKITARDLAELLPLEKSEISRVLGALINKGLVIEGVNPVGGRAKTLLLSPNGEAELAQLDSFAAKHAEMALATTSEDKSEIIPSVIGRYTEAREATRSEAPLTFPQVETGYCPGLLGKITALHATHYADTVGFGVAFETMVAIGMADFLPRLERPQNQIWWVRHQNDIVGGLSVDGEDLGGNIAHLRWFILDGSLRGRGIGNQMMQAAMTHCRNQGFERIDLWTFSGLHAARALYEKYGFVLVSETLGNQWGKEVLEQKFSCHL